MAAFTKASTPTTTTTTTNATTTTTTSAAAAASTVLATTKASTLMAGKQRIPCSLQQQQQLRCNRLAFRLNRMATLAVVVAIGLISMLICVSGQIDGYEPGVDYPVYEAVPKGLSFNCQGREPGYYADTETRCQVWHWCLHSGHQYSFLCPNGTVFNQAVRVCDWWSNVNCPGAEELYENNLELYRTVSPNEEPAL